MNYRCIMVVMSTDTSARPETRGTVTSEIAAKPAPGQVRRSELASFLRSRRERIEPEVVGLPPGPRRRTPGLRREEVAQLAGVGVTWYTWLEQGRQINASVQVLDAVARTLRLDQAETEHLYRLADVPSVPVVTDCGKPDPEVQMVIDAVAPFPAAIANGRSDVLGWNKPYALLFPFLVNAPLDKRNSLWQCFTAFECCHPFVNRADELGRMVAAFRSRYGRHLNEPAWTEFVKRLSAASPKFAELWENHDVADSATRLKIFRHPGLGLLNCVVNSFEVVSMPETRMTVYTPNDEETRAKFELVRLGAVPKGAYPCGHTF
jgi:transcriptional regulator with XRE-family HTH domain